MKINPPNRTKYLNRFYMTGGMCRNADVIPAYMIAGQCRMVLAQLYWRRIKHETFWTWHLYVRLKTEEEIQELLDQRVEKNTGVDIREWPDHIDSES